MANEEIVNDDNVTDEIVEEKVIAGFDADHFLTAAYEFGKAHPEYGAWVSTSLSLDELKANVVLRYPDAQPMTKADGTMQTQLEASAEALYMDEGVQYKISPNMYFDAGEYKASWIQKYSAGRTITADQASAVFDAAVANYEGDYYAHYLAEGALMGVNPSNDFDESDYFQNMITTLGLDQDDQYDNIDTVTELRAYAQQYGFTALDFYTDFPELQEDFPAVPVAGDEIVDSNTSQVGEVFTLVATADNIKATDADDTIVATDATLTPGDKINGGEGYDELKLSADNAANLEAFEMNNVEELTVTADDAQALVFDLSGTDDIEVLRTLNSTGDTTFNEVTEVADIEVNNMTDEANLTVMFQDSAVVATTDVVNVTFINSINADINNITIGSETVANDGIETINIEVDGKGAFTDIQNFNVGMETLNIASGANDGDQDLIIRTVLSNDVTTVNATEFTADLTLGFSGAADVTYSGSAGVDTIVFGGNGDNTINTNAGNDVVTVNLGDDTIDLGEGNDTLNLVTNGLTVADQITGGTGNDTINLTGTDTIQLSEAEQVTHVEFFNMQATNTLLVVSDNMVDTADNSLFTVNMGVAGNTVDISDVTFSKTGKIAINGTSGTDVVVATDATVNAKATIAFGSGTDTLRIIDGATITADDLANISGLDEIELVADSSEQQDWHIEPVSNITISVDSDVQEGSELHIDTSNFGGSAITVNSNTNITVYVDDVVVPVGTKDANGIVTVQSSLEFTENSDTLIGTTGADLFLGESLDRFDIGDYVDAMAGTDTLQLNFQVNNPSQTLAVQLNQFTDNNTLEIVTFNTDNAVSFSDISNELLSLNGVATVNFGDGVSTVSAGATAATYNFGTANDRYTAAAAVRETLNGNAGNDTYNFGDITYYAAGDAFTGGEGTDTINVTNNNAAGLLQSVHGPIVVPATIAGPTLSGIDVINMTVTTSAFNGFVVSDTAVKQTDVGNLLTMTISDANAVANNVAIFDASDVRMGNSVNLTVTGLVDAQGYAAGNAANVAANYVNVDVIGGAGNDTLTIGGGVEGYAVAGNAGADIINISGAGDNDAWVVYQSPNDAGNAGAITGYDTITGFVSGQDAVAFLSANFAATNFADTAAGNNLVCQSDAPVNFTVDGTDNALIMTHIGTGMTDAELLDLNEVCINANVHGVTAAATNGGFIVAQGQSQSALYMYVESDGTANNVASSELKMIAVFTDTNAFGNNASDLQYVINTIPGVNAAPVINATFADGTLLTDGITLDEDVAGTPVATLVADDAEGDAITYAITDGNDDGVFAMNEDTGVITFAEDVAVDADTTYTLTVVANDGTDDSDPVTFDVTVNDEGVTPGDPTDESVDVGTMATPVTLPADTDNFNFMDDATMPGNVEITGFSNDDIITISNAADGEYSFASISDTEVTIIGNHGGIVSQILLTGLTLTQIVSDEASFETAIGFNAVEFA